MGTNGPSFYDDHAIYAAYTARRQHSDNPNNTLELPIMRALIGTVTGQRVLDLGCGDAAIGRELLEHGAAAYTGVDGSNNMVTAAQQMLAGTVGCVEQHTIEDWNYPQASFDLVIARLSLHYVADLSALCNLVWHTLVPGGRFVFSVEHPVITSCDRAWQGQGQRQAWLVDDYFSTGLRVTSWMGGTVEKYHRTVEEYFGTLQHAGFVVEQLRESCPQPQHFPDQQLYERRMRIPLFLLLAARHPLTSSDA